MPDLPAHCEITSVPRRSSGCAGSAAPSGSQYRLVTLAAVIGRRGQGWLIGSLVLVLVGGCGSSAPSGPTAAEPPAPSAEPSQAVGAAPPVPATGPLPG